MRALPEGYSLRTDAIYLVLDYRGSELARELLAHSSYASAARLLRRKAREHNRYGIDR